MRNRAQNKIGLLLLYLLVLPTSALGQSEMSRIHFASPPLAITECAATLAGPTTERFVTGLLDPRSIVPAGRAPSAIWFRRSLQSCDNSVAIPSGAARILISSPKQFLGAVLHNQESVWKFPWEVARGHHWKPALAFTLTAAGLVELDPHDTPYFQRTQSFAGFNRPFSSLDTGLGEGLFPVAFFLAGRLHKDVYAENTAILAGEALADAEIVSEIMKNVGRRLRPREIPPGGDYAHTWFKEGGGILINRGSFPSGHAIGAFAMAAVIAERYRQHRWVPWVAYGLASVVGFSRISLQAHFPSDIFAGTVLGYAVSHYVVLRNR